MIKKLAFTLFLFCESLLSYQLSWADTDFDPVVTAYSQEDYKTAFKLLKKLAEQGNISAQSGLGIMYADGKGVARNYEQAAYWYQKAADQGDTLAQYNLGTMYFDGRGVVQDYKQAVYWYQKAADQGHASAQFNLGTMYGKGQGVAKNDKQAVYWYQKAADQGNASAQDMLAFNYALGQGVIQNKVIAYALANVAAIELDQARETRELISQDMTQEEISAGQDLSASMSQPGNLLKALNNYLQHR
ncbi:tetratricopeptide repeat protein [Candidatus Nitrosacidococcus sp. I8]|uniref:tetratricopeptide repeat protein n=1 Tax=Candidatus Nitrosacidococcus sp. I8 TaxID=2942908 RepID=UPI00222619A7|nr:tetratricopeptide repeat protein [Candidatus Nitrosacidococcus sp. I8]CAH9019260.1 hypothetical protein NURINAE_01429 [Candidatus Nitrosacidococcus sp. I8]